jgi:steroid Delta-isomerase
MQDSRPPEIERIVQRFEGISPDTLDAVAELYALDARFKDPFNEVQGPEAISRIFEHMFVSLDEPRFVVHEAIVQGRQAFLAWDFHFRMKRFDRAPQIIRGGSHLVLAADGRITLHRDYWDAAEELYEKLPLVGSLMRWLKKRARS